ncbi:MAG: amino acid racemase [Veillonella sp.]|nr:amino acid racemase [Veillonella sp.]
MKTIGLIGGMSWESTITYYQVLNETIKQVLGGLHSAKCILYSVDFEEIEKCQANGDWNRSAEILSDAAQSLEKAGADYIVICTNTMHKGTKYTMQQDFYKCILENRGIHVVIPNEDQVELVNDIIYNELCLGVISNESKQQYLDIIGDLVKSGVQGVILGCTEIGLLVKQDDTDIPLFDTTLIHAKNAALISIDGA